jgi:hypothetical protein
MPGGCVSLDLLVVLLQVASIMRPAGLCTQLSQLCTAATTGLYGSAGAQG